MQHSFGFHCAGCGRIIAFARFETNDALSNPVARTYRAFCAECADARSTDNQPHSDHEESR